MFIILDFDCCNIFTLSLVGKVTTGTVVKSFKICLQLCYKVVTLFTSKMIQVADQVRIRLISQLIKGILKVLKKLPKYFNGTAIFAFIIPRSLVLAKNLDLNLNELESVIGFFRSFL